jgi:hypothetical protein
MFEDGRLATPTGFTPEPWRGLGTRQQRLYLLQSLARQPNADRERAVSLLARHSVGKSLAPSTVEELLSEIWRIASDYELREAIEASPLGEAIFDSFMWRDCMDMAYAIAMETRRAETTGSVAKR